MIAAAAAARIRTRIQVNPLPFCVLTVPADAFKVNGIGNLEVLEAEETFFFETGLQRCDTKYVSKGLWSSKMCECFSIEGKCECECGETSVMRTL